MSKPPKTLTDGECDQLLNFLSLSYNPGIIRSIAHRNYTMALLMLDAGLRVGEVVQLLQTDLFHHAEPVTNLFIGKEISKSKTERTVPLTNRLQSAIQTMHANYWVHEDPLKNHFAFYDNDSAYHISERQVQRIIGKAGMESVRRSVNPHMLRHTFATRLMRTCSTRIVQQLLGHKNLSSTQIYTHPNHQDLTKAIETLNER